MSVRGTVEPIEIIKSLAILRLNWSDYQEVSQEPCRRDKRMQQKLIAGCRRGQEIH